MTDGAKAIPLDLGESSNPRAWLADIAPLVSMAALAILGFLWLVVLVGAFRFEPRLRNLVLFVASLAELPAACAAIQYWVRPNCSKPASRIFESINIWCAVLVLLAVTIIGVATWQSGGLEFWQRYAPHAVQAALIVHLALLVAFALRYRKVAPLQRVEAAIAGFSPRSVQTVALAYAFAAAVIVLFRIEPENRYFNGLFSVFFPSVAGSFPSAAQVALAALLAGLSMMVGAGLLLMERRLDHKDPAALLRIEKLALPLAAIAAIVLCFDFSLSADPLHYMTNIGPALHLMHGGTLMVDTFSQYGPGPVLLTYLAFQFGRPSFAVANIAVQLCNILFYILFLVALWQSTRHRLAALWFGLIILTFWLAGWSYGEGNVNVAPSVLGVRYLPVMLLTVALAVGTGDKRHSFLTFLASFLAALWSAEAVAGVLALHWGFLALINLRDRSFGRLALDLALACLPIVGGLMAMSLGTFLVSGKLPAFAIYMGYFVSYNPVAKFWSRPFVGLFWGWIPFLLAVTVTVGICCLAVIGGQRSELRNWTDHWLRKCLPAALLTAFTAAYFAGRAVDYVILIALLPLSLLLIPAFLWLANAAASRHRVAASLLAIPLIALLWMSSFSLLYLFRVGSTYSLVVQECRDHDRCTPAALGRGLSERLRRELALEPGTDAWAMNAYDRGIVTEAKRLVERFAADRSKVTVLLGGSYYGYQMLSDIALMYAGKWHTWPRSFTFSDELVPQLVARILAAPVHLQSGDVVIVRRDEAELGSVDAGVLKLIQSRGSLCSLEGQSDEVAAYRFSRQDDPSHPPTDCAGQLLEKRSSVRNPYKPDEMVRDLPILIKSIRNSADRLPEGDIPLAVLRHANVEVPRLFVRGDRLTTPPWGQASLTKIGSYLTLDFFGTDAPACVVLVARASRIPGVIRVATTGLSTDERSGAAVRRTG